MEPIAQFPGDGIPATTGALIAMEKQEGRPIASPVHVVEPDSADLYLLSLRLQTDLSFWRRSDIRPLLYSPQKARPRSPGPM